MSWLQPAELFVHPTVQYIPIAVETWWRGLSMSPAATTPALIWLATPEQLQQAIVHCGLPWQLTAAFNSDEFLYFLALGAEVQQCHYRANEAILVGQTAPNCAHLFRLTRRYFYKPAVTFALHDWQARPLAQVLCQDVQLPGGSKPAGAKRP